MPNTYVPAAGRALPTAQPTTFLAVTPTMRLRLATTIENLIALLDAIDGDENLEPYLAGFSGIGDDQKGDDERERDADTDEGDGDCDDEHGDNGIADLDALGYLPNGYNIAGRVRNAAIGLRHLCLFGRDHGIVGAEKIEDTFRLNGLAAPAPHRAENARLGRRNAVVFDHDFERRSLDLLLAARAFDWSAFKHFHPSPHDRRQPSIMNEEQGWM